MLKPQNLRYLPNLLSDRLRTLPLMVLYLTDGCNSRCAMCDIWKAPRANMEMGLVDQLVADTAALHTQTILLSGGEAMQHPEWATIARKFRGAGAKVWLLTNGLFLKKQAQMVIDSVDALTVSLDAATPELYEAIRGVDALDLILEGMRLISDTGVPTTTRTTLMRANYHQMPQIVDMALGAGAQSVSFLTIDTVNPYAFGPRFEGDSANPPIIPLQVINANPYGALLAEDLPQFQAVLDALEISHAAHFATGKIAESPAKLRRYYDFFAEPYGIEGWTPPRCNAPHTSLVVNVDGSLQPCYFLPKWGSVAGRSLTEAVNDDGAIALRSAYKHGEREECRRCVCPLYRNARALLQS